MVRERMYELTTPEEVDQFLKKFPTGALFKAGSCHKTMQGFAHVEAALGPYPQIHVGFIRVIESRPASNHVAEITGIKHESPQLILFVAGQAVFDLDNWDITPEALTGLKVHLGPATGSVTAQSSDLSAYLQLLERFVQGELDEAAMRMEWQQLFKSDATPRSKQEVELLQGLFSDNLISLGPYDLKRRAEALLQELR